MTFLTMTYTSLIYLFPSSLTILLFPIIPFVAWSRVELKKHTVLQVVMGILVSMLISFLVFSVM
jgi:membrane-associated phospholipid phosphatase